MQLIKSKAKEPVPIEKEKLAIDMVTDKAENLKIKEAMGESQYLNESHGEIVNKARNPKASRNQSQDKI